MYLFRVIRRVFRQLTSLYVRARVNNSEAICIVDMKKLAVPRYCQYNSVLSCYSYSIVTEKDGKFSKAEYVFGALAIATLIVEHKKDLVIHPANESPDVSTCLTMLRQAIEHRGIFINRHVKNTIEYLSC